MADSGETSVTSRGDPRSVARNHGAAIASVTRPLPQPTSLPSSAATAPPTASVVDALAPQLLAAEPALAAELLTRSLGTSPDLIDRLLGAPDTGLRLAVVAALGFVRDERTARWLDGVLHGEASADVVCVALELLADIGRREHLPGLDAVARRFVDDDYVKFAVRVLTLRILAH